MKDYANITELSMHVYTHLYIVSCDINDYNIYIFIIFLYIIMLFLYIFCSFKYCITFHM